MAMCTENKIGKGISKVVADKIKASAYHKDKCYSLLATLDDLAILWCKEDASLYSQILLPVSQTKDKKEQECPVQILRLTKPPVWEVEKVTFNKNGSKILLVGSRGVASVDLPKRWGTDSLFEGGKDSVICHTEYLGEHFFACNSKVKVLEADWHPGSLIHEHVVVLTSDNYLRIYNGSSGSSPLDTIPIGGPGSCGNVTKYGTQESPISFGVGTPINPEQGSIIQKSEEIEFEIVKKKFLELLWPIFILYNNGDVYYIISSLSPTKVHQKKLFGPMSMVPSAYDNYGLDFCSILVLSSSPVVLIIGNTSGTLHHCIVLEKEAPSKGADESFDALAKEISSLNLECSQYILHVYETIKLDLSFTTKEKPFSCSMSLFADPSTPARYWIVHEEGVHGVTIPMVERLIQLNSVANEKDLSQEDLESKIEHLVCTRSVESIEPLAVIGLGFNLTELYVTMASGITCSITIPSALVPSLPEFQYRNEDDPLQKGCSDFFKRHIQDLLVRSASQPLLISSSDALLSEEQYLNLLTQVVTTLRANYLQPQARVRDELIRRHKLQVTQKASLLEQMMMLEFEKGKCIEKAHELAEGYEEATEKHELIMARLEKMMSRIVSDLPSLSASERRMVTELQTMKDRSRDFAIEISQIEAKQTWQQEQMKKTRDGSSGIAKGSKLSENQISSLNASLKKERDIISNLKNKMVVIKQELGE